MAGQLSTRLPFGLRYYANKGHRGSRCNVVTKIRQEFPRGTLFWNEASQIPAAMIATATQSVTCLFLAQFKTTVMTYYRCAGISMQLFQAKDLQGVKRDTRFYFKPEATRRMMLQSIQDMDQSCRKKDLFME